MFTPVRFGKYLLTDKIAQGGMAEILLAKLYGAEGFEKEIVIKKILPQWSTNKEFLKMLIDEAKLAALLNHANIVQIYELGKEGDDHYIAMEYVPGVDLRGLWEKANAPGKGIPIDISLFIMIQALEGLSYAHSKKNAHGENLGIVHRDISPHNILLSFDGAVKLTDFGIAKAVIRTTETLSGVHKGKFPYMSPEQANLAPVGQPSDIFSAGIVLYELVTGRRLFGGLSDIEALDRIRKTEITFTPEEKKFLPERLREIILTALARSPEDRFLNAASFREALSRLALESGWALKREELVSFLEELFGGKASTKPVETTRVIPTGGVPKKRKRIPVGALGLSIGLAAVLAIFLVPRQRPPAPLPSAGGGHPAAMASNPPPSLNAPPASNGYLSVIILPWGYVSIDGGEKKNSPIRKLSIKEGRHRLTTLYQPEGLSLNASLEIKPGLHLRCLANFETKPGKLSCQ